MALVPTGCLSEPQQNLKLLLGDCAAFQDFCGTPGDVNSTLQHIYLVGLPEPQDHRAHAPFELIGFRPFAIINMIRTGGGYRAGHTAAGSSGFQFHESGRLQLWLERNAPALPEVGGSYTPAEADLDFQNSIGEIIGDMSRLAGQGGYLGIDEIVVTDGPWRNLEEDWDAQGPAQFVFIEVAWGGTGNGAD